MGNQSEVDGGKVVTGRSWNWASRVEQNRDFFK